MRRQNLQVSLGFVVTQSINIDVQFNMNANEIGVMKNALLSTSLVTRLAVLRGTASLLEVIQYIYFFFWNSLECWRTFISGEYCDRRFATIDRLSSLSLLV